MSRKTALARLRVWKEVVWRPWVWVLTAVYFVLQLYQWFKGEWLTPEAQDRWRLPNILPTFRWWQWLIGWLVLFIVVVLEGAYRAIRDRDRATAARAASEPNLEVVFDPNCEACFNESGTQVCLGIWNKGRTAEDVQVYLASVTPGPTLGKRQLTWVGEGPVGRRINTSIQSGHHHFHLMSAGVEEPYYLIVNAPIGALANSQPYIAEVLVEGRNIHPILVRVEIDPSKEPPIRRVSPMEYLTKH